MTVPHFAIGQEAKLVHTPEGNILWDCISYLDDATYELIQGIGGLKAIAISHPHFYTGMVTWADRFDVPIYLHELDAAWVLQGSDRIHHWSGSEHRLAEGVTLHRLGGHFDGSTILHWRGGAHGKGVLLTGDTLSVSGDKRTVSAMYSFPNRVPLSEAIIRRMQRKLEPLSYDRLYGLSEGDVISEGAKAAVDYSLDRYIKALHRPAD